MTGRDGNRLQTVLNDTAARYDVPGASLAILEGGEVAAELATGVTNLNTGVPTTPDTVFQIGSITKVWTATLAMRLVEAGELGLDVSVHVYLPELRFADGGSDTMTVRHLLAHTSGIPSDNFQDFGRGDDALQKFVTSLGTLSLEHPPGEVFSYSNGAYSLLGRIIEKTTGVTYDRALAQRVLEPLGLRTTTTFPEEAILRRVAVGHFSSEGRGLEVTPVWSASRAVGPEGLICTTAAELLKFVWIHANDGRTLANAPILSHENVQEMQTSQVRLSKYIAPGVASWGLGWSLLAYDGPTVLAHDGIIMGQSAFVRVVPELGFAVALLTNRDGDAMSARVHDDLLRFVFPEFLDLPPPTLPAPADVTEPVDPDSCVGRYERLNAAIEIRDDAGDLRFTVMYAGDLTAHGPREIVSASLAPVDERTFAIEGTDLRNPYLTFFSLSEARRRPEYVHFFERAHRRIDVPAEASSSDA